MGAEEKTEYCVLQPGWKMKTFSVQDSHTFFGYYDIACLDEKEERMLAHVIPLQADADRDPAMTGYFDIVTGEFREIAETRAWCWQQGARLRWHPDNSDQVVFNNMRDGHYTTEVWNIAERSCKKVIDWALYDFDAQFSYGLSLNFSRLQRIRPGYGYNILKDTTEGDMAPENDGILLVDLKSNRAKLIVSLRKLAYEVDPNLEHEHYINHISIAPDGKRFMFFHIWTVNEAISWRTRLYVYELETGECRLLESKDIVSHYDWKNSQELLVTCYEPDKTQYYAVYNAVTGEKKEIARGLLDKDGHPSFYKSGDAFITDTYPLEQNLQHLYRYLPAGNRTEEIMTIFSSPLMDGEKRCDLHPRLSGSQRMISVDSTYSQNRRKIILLQKE